MRTRVELWLAASVWYTIYIPLGGRKYKKGEQLASFPSLTPSLPIAAAKEEAFFTLR